MKINTILVAGGCGFIGSHLCESLLLGGNRVVALDNFSTGSRDNVDHLLSNPHFSIVEHDVRNPISDLNMGIFNMVYNLASPASPIHYQRDPVNTLLTNVVGASNLLKFSLDNCARYLQASTSEVYGNPLVHPQVESYYGNVNPTGIRACYDEGKRAAEALVMDYRRMYGLDVRIVRIFNTYGPRMAVDDGRVVSNFICAELSGDPIVIYGSGSQTRSFCYVSDTVAGLVAVMSGDIIDPVNIGNPVEVTIGELAGMVGGNIEYRDGVEDDPVRRKPVIELARSLGWEPVVGLGAGLALTRDYFRGIIGGK